ncbi:MAG: glycosyltransferase [Actinobacteria bacterium]|nr:glycosyltransferase [Actinomycetota bacterium]
MKIGIFTNNYKPLISGITTSISLSMAELRKNGHEVFIFAPDYPDYIDDDPCIFRYPSISTYLHPNFRIPISFSPQVDRKIKDIGIEIVHSQHPFALGPHGYHLGRRSGIPIVFTYNSIYENFSHNVPLPKPIVDWYSINQSINFSNKCDLVIVPTQAVADLIKMRGVKKPVKVISSGIDFSYIERADPKRVLEKYPQLTGKNILLYIGRTSAEKGVDFLVRVFSKVAEKKDDVYFLVVGSPETAEIPKMVIELGLTDRVIMADDVSYEEVFDYYLAADIFIFASYGETQGLVLTESLSTGLPIVAVKAIGVNEVIDDNITGILVNRDEDLMMDRIIYLLDNPNELKRLSQNASVKARKYSIQDMTIELEKIYEELLRKYARNK